MNRSIVLCLAFWFSIYWMWARDASASNSLWQPLADGIDYREFFLSDPNHVYVARLDQTSQRAIIETSLANGALSAGLEPLRAQTARYDQALGYFDDSWGPRYHVIAAINGGFFDPKTGFLSGGLIHSGWYASQFKDRQTVGGFAWRDDRLAFVSECLVQPPGKQLVILTDTGQSIPFNGINLPHEKDQIILYTPQYGARTPPEGEVLEILVELERPLMLAEGEAQVGTIRNILEQGGTLIPFDHLVISANGAPVKKMKGHFAVGKAVGFSLEIRHLEAGCRKERSESMFGVSAGLAGGGVFLRNGEVQPLNDLGSVLRNPRTAVAMNERYVYFIVVDGRDQLRSLGMSMVELALFAKLKLGAAWGVAMDGGGSSTMVVKGKVMNHPNSETIVRPRSEDTPRAVADGLMMAALEPMETSTRFRVGDGVMLSAEGEVNLRLGPGTNFPSLGQLPNGSKGVVMAHPLNGVLAKGHYWWKISFGEQTGWVSESVLQSDP